MAFEPVSKDLEVKFTKILNQESVPVVMTVTGNEVVISRVISITARPCVDNLTSNNGSVQIDGKVHCKVLVETTNGDFDSIESANNFTIHIMNSEITPESEIFATATLDNIGSIQASEQAVTFTCKIGVKPILVSSEKFKVIEKVSDLAEQKTDEIQYTDLVASASQNFDLDMELDLPNSVSKILGVDSQVVLNKIEAGNDLVSLSGELYCNLIYLTADEEPKLKNQKYIQDFSHELLANNITNADLVDANLQICQSSFEVQGELNSSKGTVLLKNDIKTNIFVRQNKTCSAVVDAFCPNYILNTEYSSFTQQRASADLVYDKIDGSIVLGEDSPRIDKILAVCSGNVVLQKVDRIDEGLNLQGVLTCNVIYKLDDDDGSVQSVFAEVPFNIVVKRDNLLDNMNFVINILPKDVEARNKKSKEIDILADLTISITTVNNENGVTLQNITLGEKRPQNNTALGLYIIPEAQDLWEVSKHLLVSGDLIMQQNPELQFPITTPQRIVVYRQKHL